MRTFIDSRYEDIQHMVSENRERMNMYATRDMAKDIEGSLKNQIRKYEEEVDCVQKTLRDTLNKFNDCQARLNKQIEINTMRGAQLQQQIEHGGPSPALREVQDKVKRIEKAMHQNGEAVKVINHALHNDLLSKDQTMKLLSDKVTRH